MFRPATRLIARPSFQTLTRAAPTKRFLSTAPPSQKSRSWKSSIARWGAAGAIVYYYNTTDIFAEEPAHTTQHIPETDHESEQLPTIDNLAQERQQRRLELQKAAVAESGEGGEPHGTDKGLAGGVEGLEEEADQQGAFNPETGEINWDCPCLGGMAHGPCGEEFRAAFSCFIYSEEEPKGMDCIEKFKGMQSCFRQYPEIYGEELQDDEDDNVTATDHGDEVPPPPSESSPESTPVNPSVPQKSSPTLDSEQQAKRESSHGTTEQVKKEKETDDAIPKDWHDERSENKVVEKKNEN